MPKVSKLPEWVNDAIVAETPTASAKPTDPRIVDILRSVGDLSDVTVLGDYVLVATYVRPAVTKSGIFIPGEAQREDIYQGKTGLVIKVGETAFKYRGAFKYEGRAAQVGEWVSYRVSDGWSMKLNGVDCRMIDCNDLRMILPSPEALY